MKTKSFIFGLAVVAALSNLSAKHSTFTNGETDKSNPVSATITKDRLDLNLNTHNQASTVVIRIYNAQNRIVWEEESLNSVKAVHRRYNFGGLSNGEYKVEVKTGDQVYFYTFKKAGLVFA